MKHLLVLAMLLSGAHSAAAQALEVGALVSYSSSSSLDRTAEGVDELEIDDGLTWGARGTYFLTERFGIEGLWSYQSTALMITSGGSRAEVFEMTINQVVGNAVYEILGTGARLRPFVFAGAGATFFEAPDLVGETKLAWNLGAGVIWFPLQRIGVEGRFRFRPTHLGATDDGTCGPFGFCQGSLNTIELALGAVFRF